MNHIVLVYPQIPQNTGNIMRTCVATNSMLHLIEPIGFMLDDKSMKRAGLDYIKDLSWKVHKSWEDFLEDQSPEESGMFFFTRYSKVIYTEANYSFKGEHYLCFGHEHDGIPKEILREHLDRCYRIPMYSDTRSLNLSNSVAIGLYEALRQQGFEQLSGVEVQKGEDFLYEMR